MDQEVEITIVLAVDMTVDCKEVTRHINQHLDLPEGVSFVKIDFKEGAEIYDYEEQRLFMYFESQEGGMCNWKVTCTEDLRSGLRGWMTEDCLRCDVKLLAFMETSEVGDTHDHRLGVLVRLK